MYIETRARETKKILAKRVAHTINVHYWIMLHVTYTEFDCAALLDMSQKGFAQE